MPPFAHVWEEEEDMLEGREDASREKEQGQEGREAWAYLEEGVN